MKSETKISIIMHSVLAVLVIVGLAVAAKFDLAISQKIGDGNNFFGVLFQVIAEYPAYLAFPVASVILFYNSDSFPDKHKSIAFRVFAVVLSLVGWFLMCYNTEKLATIPHLLGLCIFFAIFFTCVSLWIGSMADREVMHKLLKWAVFALIFTIVALIFMQVIKNIWCRMRYRDMLKEGNFDGFTPWYKINFGVEKLSEDYHYTSFPSGHTSSATHLFLLIPLCKILPKWNKKSVKYGLYIFSTVFVLLTMVARIVNCAHFLSDVIVGGALTYAIYYVCEKICFKNKKYEYARNERVGGF